MIDAIDVSTIDDTIYKNKRENKLMVLENIKRINIFIGENNSGKSRMLRNLIKKDSMNILSNTFITDSNINYVKSKFQNIKNAIEYFNRYSNDIEILLPQNLETLSFVEKYIAINDYLESLNINRENLQSTPKSYLENIYSCLREIYSYLVKPTDYAGSSKSINKCDIIYIPVLRGIENFNQYYSLKKNNDLETITMNERQREALEEYKSNAKHLYLNKISKVYNITNTKHIFTAENLYEEITSKLLGEEEGRIFIREFQNFISREFYDGEEFTIIPQQTKGYLNVKIGNEKERALFDLGDGIKQLITIFYKIFEKRDKTALFFIEEPEINLHPGYQRKLLEILQSDIFEKHQYFITTHSNHLIDSCFDYNNVSIFKFINEGKQNNTFKVINTSPNDVEMLQLLGVNNSSVFLSNCTIWVEGISDKILISKYLEVYLKSKNIEKYKEDINYSFVEYGGNNITHWSFIPTEDIETINSSGITNRSFIICDNDNNSKSKKARKKKLKEIFDTRFYELQSREIENTINRNVLEKTLFPNDQEIVYKEEYEGNAYATPEARMGTFIDEHYILNKKYGNTETGTVSGKLEFAKKIANNIKTKEDLTEETIDLCKKIYNFIKISNS